MNDTPIKTLPPEELKRIKDNSESHYTYDGLAAADIIKLRRHISALEAENGELKKQNGGISIVCKENAQLRAQLEELKTNFIKFTELPAGDARITGQKLDSCERQCKRQEDEIDQLHAQISQIQYCIKAFLAVEGMRGVALYANAIELLQRCIKNIDVHVTPNQTILEWIEHVRGKAETLFFEAKGMMPNPDIHIWSSAERTKFVTLTDISGEINTYSAAIKEKLEKGVL